MPKIPPGIVRIEIFKDAISGAGTCALCGCRMEGLIRFDPESIVMTEARATFEMAARMEQNHRCPALVDPYDNRFDRFANPHVNKPGILDDVIGRVKNFFGHA